MKTQSEIRINPLKEPTRINLILEKDQLAALKSKAAFYDTTVNEILRALITEYIKKEDETLAQRVFFVIHYGIKAFNSDGSERSGGTDATSGAFYTDIETALAAQRVWFDGMCEELKLHKPSRRTLETAFSYIEAISGVTEDGCDGEPVEWTSLPKDIQEKLNKSSLELKGSDV